jgi:hypothetical protein
VEEKEGRQSREKENRGDEREQGRTDKRDEERRWREGVHEERKKGWGYHNIVVLIHRDGWTNDSPYSLWQDDPNGSLLHQLVIKHVIDQPHVQHVVAPIMEQVLIGGDIVTIVIACLPATKQGEPEGAKVIRGTLGCKGHHRDKGNGHQRDTRGKGNKTILPSPPDRYHPLTHLGFSSRDTKSSSTRAFDVDMFPISSL